MSTNGPRFRFWFGAADVLVMWFLLQIDEAEAENCTEIAAITTTHRFINQFVLKAAGHLGRDLALLLLGRGAKPILDEAREQNLARDEQVV